MTIDKASTRPDGLMGAAAGRGSVIAVGYTTDLWGGGAPGGPDVP